MVSTSSLATAMMMSSTFAIYSASKAVVLNISQNPAIRTRGRSELKQIEGAALTPTEQSLGGPGQGL
jgi:hypothetical protein